MPLYEYRCHGCGQVFEFLARAGASGEELPCPGCGQTGAQRLFPSRVAFRFKGGYPSWVDRLDARQKRQADRGEKPTLPPYAEVA